MKKYSISQLRAISYAYSRKNQKEAEEKADKIKGMNTAYQYSDYVYLGNALKNQSKCFAEAEKNLKKRIENNRSELKRATEKGCKQVYLNSVLEKISLYERRLKIVQSGMKELNKK